MTSSFLFLFLKKIKNKKNYEIRNQFHAFNYSSSSSFLLFSQILNPFSLSHLVKPSNQPTFILAHSFETLNARSKIHPQFSIDFRWSRTFILFLRFLLPWIPSFSDLFSSSESLILIFSQEEQQWPSSSLSSTFEGSHNPNTISYI